MPRGFLHGDLRKITNVTRTPGTEMNRGFFIGKGGNEMKWPKLLNEMYRACLAHDTIKEKKLFMKALKKNIKARNKNKPRTVPQVTVRG